MTLYDAESVEAGLLELATWHGSARNASRSLAQRGIDIPSSTLESWKKSHADRFAAIESRVLPEIRGRLVAQQELIARRASEVALQIIERTADELNEIPARDLPGAARNMEVTAATATDKHSLIHNFPTEIVQTVGLDELYRKLHDLLGGEPPVDSSAVEIVEAAQAITAQSESPAG